MLENGTLRIFSFWKTWHNLAKHLLDLRFIDNEITIWYVYIYFLFIQAEIKCQKTNSILNVPHLVVTPDKEGYLYNETVSLQCKDGFTLQGSSQATCLQNFEAQNHPFCLGKLHKRIVFQCFYGNFFMNKVIEI